jgi:ankyrin repeat protein
MEINDRFLDGSTAVFLAVKLNKKELVEELIAQGADVNIPNDANFKPIFIAVRNNNFEIVDILLKAGAKDYDALDYVQTNEMCDFLFSNGLDLNGINDHGEDIGTSAIHSGNTIFFDYIVSKGVDLSNALNFSIKNKNIENINKLLNNENLITFKEEYLYNAYMTRKPYIVSSIISKYDDETIQRIKIKALEYIKIIKKEIYNFEHEHEKYFRT